MTPVETVWIGLVIVFALVGLVRGFLKELGVTLVLVVTLFGLTRLAPNTSTILNLAASVTRIQAINRLSTNDSVWLVFYLFAVLAATFIAYQGYVIKYPGNDPKGAPGILLSLMVGLINGYLLSGSLWFYIDKFQAPVRALGLLQGEYTMLAQKLVKVLPPAILGPYLPFLVVFMIILLVLK